MVRQLSSVSLARNASSALSVCTALTSSSISMCPISLAACSDPDGNSLSADYRLRGRPRRRGGAPGVARSPPLIASPSRGDSLADAEPAEDGTEEIVGSERAGDLAERVVGEAELLGEELERGVAAAGVRARLLEVRARALER